MATTVRASPEPARAVGGRGRAVPARDSAAARTTALRLAMGLPPFQAIDAEAWSESLVAAVEERCTPLAWLRSSSSIRLLAPPDVTRSWRTAALAATARAEADWDALVAICRGMEAQGIAMTVLKGAPLAMRLHGDIAARPASDIDVFIPPPDRRRARAVLASLGWRHAEGDLPWDESHVRPCDRREQLLEVHSSLLHPRLGYLGLSMPDAEEIRIDGVRMRVQGGASLAAYLAVHLATHQFAPLLWWLDLRTLWAGLASGERRVAERAAEHAGAARYLRWALRRVEALERLADGDGSRLHLLGVSGSRRTGTHPMWRHLWLAPSAAARRAALADWLWPSWMRETYGASPLGFGRRLARHAGALLPGRRPLA